MQLFINNWSAALTAPATASAVSLSVPLADAAKLTGLGGGDHYLLTLAELDGNGLETAWEIVKVTGAASGVLTVHRAQEGTTALDWVSASAISSRATKGTLEALRAGTGTSVGDDVPQALGVASPGASAAASRQDHVHAKPTAADIGAATTAQGAKADTAVQPAALASGLAGKVDKDGTKVLSDQNYTSAEKAKLAGLEGAHFKGLHASLAALQAAHPSAAAGDYADVDSGAGADVARYIWDVSDSAWIIQSGASGSMTAAQIKTAYESNPDTNAFSDTEQAKLAAIASGATANATDAALRDRSTHTGTQPASTISDFASTVRGTVLTGLSLANSAAGTATDSVLVFLGKLQAQITGKQGALVSGTNIKTINGASLLGAGDLPIAGVGGAPSDLSATAWVELATGSDSTGAVGDIAKPFLTINAALDALPASGGRIFLSRGAHAPIKDDYLAGTGLDPASKLKSNVTFIGAGEPELNHPTAPTGLNTDSGTVIKGPIIIHSTRHNLKFFDLGVDSGAAVCTSLYGGTAQEGISWFNIGQIDGLAQAKGAELHNVISLCKDATASVHAIGLENVIDPYASNISAYFGTHGLALKSIGGNIQGLRSYGHSADIITIKESNTGNNTAPCKNTIVSGVVGGSLAGGDTPVGIWLDTASTRELAGIVISGVVLAGISSYELKTTTYSTGNIRNIRIDGMTSDGHIRTSISGLTEKNSVFINGDPLGTLGLIDATTIQTDASSHLSGGVFSITPGAAGRTLANPTNLTVGKTYLWLINTGSGTITSYGSLFSFLPNATPTTSAAAGVDVLSAVYDGTKLRAVYSKP